MKLNKKEVVPHVVKLFQDMTSEQKLISSSQTSEPLLLHIIDTFRRVGDNSLVPALLPLISKKYISRSIRLQCINSIGQLDNDSTTVDTLVLELTNPDIADAVHHTLWSISRRLGVTISQGGASSATKTR